MKAIKKGLAVLLIAAMLVPMAENTRLYAQEETSDAQDTGNEVQTGTGTESGSAGGQESGGASGSAGQTDNTQEPGSGTGTSEDPAGGTTGSVPGGTSGGETDGNQTGQQDPEAGGQPGQTEEDPGSETDPDKTEETEPLEQEAEDEETEEEAEVETLAEKPSIVYSVHAQTYGWIAQVKDGAQAGTTGEKKRLESIRISVDGSGVQGSIEYRAYVEGQGWTAWVKDGAEAGTTGQKKRLEAFQVRLTGALAEQYDVYYSAHAQTYGWLDWAKNGATSGTIGYDKRLECVKIVLTEKDGQAPGATAAAKHVKDVVSYSVHAQTYGWMTAVSDGAMSGTQGQKKRVEALQIMLKSETEGNVSFRGYVEGQGWTSWSDNFGTVGTTGQKKRLEAVQIKLEGDLAEKYDIYYRTHVQTYGWLDWAKNGATSGSVGYDKRLEAIEIRLVAKGGSAPGATASPSREFQGLRYETYVEGQGWKQAENGAECGTTNQKKRIESLKILVSDPEYSGSVTYSAYVQSYGWQSAAKDGAATGTAGSGKRMEAIKVELTGELKEHYDIYYQVHVQSIGWMGWAKNGEIAGTFQNSKRIEAIRIELVEKGGPAPGSTENASYAYDLTTQAYVEGTGWKSATNQEVCGTTGQSKGLESLRISVKDYKYSGDISYQVYTSDVGWNTEVKNGAAAGTAGSGKDIEAIKASLSGELAEKYDIYYRVHSRSYGWLGWTKNGSPAGSIYRDKRIEAVEIRMIPKVLAAPGTIGNAFKSDIHGVDVSAYNGTVLWSSVKNMGIEFAMLRITTKSLSADAAFEANYNGAVANGIRVGVYKYGYATTVAEAKEEARSVINTLKGRPLSFPVAYDVEDSVQAALSKSELNAIIDAFQTEIENAGYRFMLYANLNWLTNILDAQHFADEDIWIARYRDFGLGHGYTGPGNVTIWQYTSSGSVTGISGNVDRDVAYKLY